MDEKDLERGEAASGDSNTTKKKKEQLVEANAQISTLTERLRNSERDKGAISRMIDFVRTLILSGTIVLFFSLGISIFVKHPALDFNHKYYLVGGTMSACAGFAASLWWARGSPALLLTLTILGTGVFMFVFGFAVSELRHLFPNGILSPSMQ